jgi:hypothetical protein
MESKNKDFFLVNLENYSLQHSLKLYNIHNLKTINIRKKKAITFNKDWKV